MPPPLLTDQGPSPDHSRGRPVAGQDAFAPPAVSLTALIEEMIQLPKSGALEGTEDWHQ